MGIGAAVAVSVGGGGLLTATALTEPASAAVFVPTTPCRSADTRAVSTVGPRSVPIEANWACGDDNDTVGELDCDANQSAGYDGTSWVCRSTPIVSTLSRLDSFAHCCTIDVLFGAYSPNVQSDSCNDFACDISLVDVLDHTGCNVTYTGNSNQDMLTTRYNTGGLLIERMHFLVPHEPLYVTISCVA